MSAVIVRKTHTSVATFAGIPTQETRKALNAAGFTYDGKSRQWIRREEVADVIGEESVANYFAS
jgi:hypothetical protein